MSNTTFVDNELPYYLQHRQSTLLRDLTLNNRQKQLALGPGHPEECLLPRHGLIRSLLKGARLSRYPAAAPVATAVLRFREVHKEAFIYPAVREFQPRKTFPRLRYSFVFSKERESQPKTQTPGFLFPEENTTQRRGQQNTAQRRGQQCGFFLEENTPSGEEQVNQSPTPGFLFSEENTPSGETAGQSKSQTPGFLFSEENTAQRRGQQIDQSPKHQGFFFRKITQPSGEDSRSPKVPTTRVSFAERTVGGFNFNSRSEEASKRASLNSQVIREESFYIHQFLEISRLSSVKKYFVVLELRLLKEKRPEDRMTATLRRDGRGGVDTGGRTPHPPTLPRDTPHTNNTPTNTSMKIKPLAKILNTTLLFL
ncbi:hypothetical protein J6590_010686 [Homalodisca vitripennis]|nr:hypothetical protein J6590_010686 [Homalodisca vitripennis]